MSTSTSTPNLFSSLPPPPKFTSCPILCQAETPIPANFAQVDAFISQKFASAVPRLLLQGIVNNDSLLKKAGQMFLQNSSLESPDGPKSIAARTAFLKAIKDKVHATRSNATNKYIHNEALKQFSREVAIPALPKEIRGCDTPITCRCVISSKLQHFEAHEPTSRIESLNVTKTTMAVFGLFLSGPPPLTSAGLSAAQNKQRELYPLVNPLAKEVLKMMEIYLRSSSSSQFFDLMQYIGGMKLLTYANLSLVGERSKLDSYKLLPFDGIITMLNSKRWKEEGGVELLEKMKLEADTAAGLKQYDSAIETYSIISTLIPSVNALANGAALRLRVAQDTDILQFYLVIIDCTYALELDPNHVKALFRRGLAHCKLKMWNEGIVDFQRAVELDPRSPAVKELAYALRQVGRRLEE